MNILDSGSLWTRRRALKLGAGFTSGVLATATLGSPLARADDRDHRNDHDSDSDDPNTAPPQQDQNRLESLIDAKGQVSNGVFSINLDRKDITNVTLHGVPITPSFQINGSFVFQSLGSGQLMFNADMALKPEELDPFISKLIEYDIVFQAEHQHMYDFNPIVWFTHFRGKGSATMLGTGIKAALDVTGTPFPQAPPSNPKTPLPAAQMGKIIGATPSISSDGVVRFQVPRAEPIRLGGVRINPYLNTETPIAFQPLSGGKAAAVPDFGMIASEINPVVGLMRKQGWDTGCLYNQETDEYPQLYFSHNFKTGDPFQLAQEIRNGLNLMHVKLM